MIVIYKYSPHFIQNSIRIWLKNSSGLYLYWLYSDMSRQRKKTCIVIFILCFFFNISSVKLMTMWQRNEIDNDHIDRECILAQKCPVCWDARWNDRSINQSISNCCCKIGKKAYIIMQRKLSLVWSWFITAPFISTILETTWRMEEKIFYVEIGKI